MLPIGSVLTFVVMNAVVGSSTDTSLIYHQRLIVSAMATPDRPVPSNCQKLFFDVRV